MDTPVSLGAQGAFPVDAGGVYRLTCWISGNAFGIFPWNAPGRRDIEAAVQSAGGWEGAPHVFLQLDKDKPADWPDESSIVIPGDGLVVRAEGKWAGPGQVITASLAIPGQDEPLHVAQVWRHDAAAPAPGPAPSPAPPPGPAPSPPPRRGPPPPPPPPGDAGSDGNDGQRARRRGALAKVAFGGALVLGITALVARSRARLARAYVSERRT